jgi:tRNA (cmo5U34)-methyltransferase
MSDSAAVQTAGWTDPGQVDWYLQRIGRLEARLAGEAVLADVLPPTPRRLLDLGCGDARLVSVVRDARPTVDEVVAVDRSEPMLQRAGERFGDDPSVELRVWDLHDPITELGEFDVIVSGFAIHHLDDARKRQLFGEIAGQLRPGGSFLNLEVVASASPGRHAAFLRAIGRDADDPEDRLVPVEDQLRWMRDAGLAEVDCLWRWRGFALLVGDAPAS